jgi:hypothetical protein
MLYLRAEVDMHHKVQEYIDKINGNTNDTLLCIDLAMLGLISLDVDPLMDALAKNKVVASKITSIYICGNSLDSITILKTLVNLKYLSLFYNKLTTIEIPGTLCALQTLELSGNQLTSLIISETLVALECLYLNGNRLTAIIIPETLCALQTVCLYHNNLTTFIVHKTWVNLKRLELYSNKLTTIDVPETLAALQVLQLNNNKLTTAIIPKALVTLEELNLAYNMLTNAIIPDTLISLELLYLEGNQLNIIDIHRSWIALRELRLSNNKLINVIIHDTLTALKVLCLDDNQLTSIIIPENLSLNRFYVAKNPLWATSLTAFGAFNIKNRRTLTDSDYSRFTELFDNLERALDFHTISRGLPVTFSGFAENLTIDCQRQYLLIFLRESINLALISSLTLDKSMRLPEDLVLSAIKINMPFNSFAKQMLSNSDMSDYLLNLFSNHNNLPLSDEDDGFLNDSRLAVEMYQEEHINDINNIDLMLLFKEEQEPFITDIQQLLKSLRDNDGDHGGVKGVSITRNFFDNLKSILKKAGFSQEALYSQDLQILLPLLVPSKLRTRPKLAM